ncbi:MAG: hypothetical protein E7Z72_00160 [Methanocorpusculum parvum]|nr:hypothetical protein [Methanocorpusculum parvum]
MKLNRKNRCIVCGVLLTVFCLLLLPGIGVADEVTVSTYAELQDALEVTGTRTVYVAENITAAEILTVASNANITLKPEGKNITISFENLCVTGIQSGLIYIETQGVLTISGDEDGHTLTINGTQKEGNNASIVRVNGILTLNHGIILANNSAQEYGGGVLVRGSGQFTMNGGNIINCISSFGGGAIAVRSHFIMNGGTISGNSAASGGGIYISQGTVEISGGTVTCNSAYGTGNTGGGGGIYLANPSVLTISGGKISENSAVNGGDGIHIAASASGNTVAHCITISKNPEIDGLYFQNMYDGNKVLGMHVTILENFIGHIKNISFHTGDLETEYFTFHSSDYQLVEDGSGFFISRISESDKEDAAEDDENLSPPSTGTEDMEGTESPEIEGDDTQEEDTELKEDEEIEDGDDTQEEDTEQKEDEEIEDGDDTQEEDTEQKEDEEIEDGDDTQEEDTEQKENEEIEEGDDTQEDDTEQKEDEEIEEGDDAQKDDTEQKEDEEIEEEGDTGESDSKKPAKQTTHSSPLIQEPEQENPITPSSPEQQNTETLPQLPNIEKETPVSPLSLWIAAGIPAAAFLRKKRE